MVEACGLSTEPPRILSHDNDGCFGAHFDRRVESLGIKQVRTPVKAPKANAIAERWVRSIRNECLNHRPILGRQHLQRAVNEYVGYYNRWRPHRRLGQIAPRAAFAQPRRRFGRKVTGEPILSGLHHVYQLAA
jgi:transposase InsO family protein